ncbi:MAG: hypothetical protein HXY50_12075 [Ignavibacteriaceae bacterium]|nr:hypothetical protein [Ignavibacteriaceae bacterium]
MNESQSSVILRELEEILDKYLPRRDVFELLYNLELSNILFKVFYPNVYRGQHKIDDSSFNHQISELAKNIISFSEKRVSMHYHYKLVMEIVHFMIKNDELKLASELSENLIVNIKNEKEYKPYEAEAYLALAKIAVKLGYWEQSIRFEEKSYEIHSKLEDPMIIKRKDENHPGFQKQLEQNEKLLQIGSQDGSQYCYYSLIKTNDYVNKLLEALSN